MDQFRKVEDVSVKSIDKEDDTDFGKAKVIVRQALPSSGANFLGCATSVVNLYYFAKSTKQD